MKPLHARAVVVLDGRLSAIRHVLLLSLLVGVSVLTTGTAAKAAPAPVRPGPAPASVSTDPPGRALEVVPRARADRCAQVARNAGYRTRDRLIMAVAVGMGESRCRSSVWHRSRPTPGCPNGSIDRGIWQINDCYHAEVSDSCAQDAQCNANAAYRISRQGTDWRPWAAYQNRSYRRFLSQAQAAVDRLHH
jgi:hypothetical protein